MVVSAYQSFQEKCLKHRRYIFSSNIKTWKLGNWVKIASGLKRNFNLWIKEQRINKIWELKLNYLKFYSVLKWIIFVHNLPGRKFSNPYCSPFYQSLSHSKPHVFQLSYTASIFLFKKIIVLNKFRMLECKHLYFFHWNIVRKNELQVILEFS